MFTRIRAVPQVSWWPSAGNNRARVPQPKLTVCFIQCTQFFCNPQEIPTTFGICASHLQKLRWISVNSFVVQEAHILPNMSDAFFLFSFCLSSVQFSAIILAKSFYSFIIYFWDSIQSSSIMIFCFSECWSLFAIGCLLFFIFAALSPCLQNYQTHTPSESIRFSLDSIGRN